MRTALPIRRILGWVFFALLLVFFFGGRSWVAGLGCGSMPLVFVVGHWIERRVRRLGLECYQHLYRMGYAVCPACEYDLQAVPQAIKCPECGLNVGPEQCWTAWQARLRSWCGQSAVVPPYEARHYLSTSTPPAHSDPQPPDADAP